MVAGSASARRISSIHNFSRSATMISERNDHSRCGLVPSAQLAGTDSPKDLREFLVETNDLVNGAKPFTVVEEAKRAARVDKIVTNCLIIPAAEGGYARDGIQCLKGCESQMSKWRGENDFTDDEGRKRKKIMNFNYYRARVSASAPARRILFLLSTIAGHYYSSK